MGLEPQRLRRVPVPKTRLAVLGIVLCVVAVSLVVGHRHGGRAKLYNRGYHRLRPRLLWPRRCAQGAGRLNAAGSTGSLPSVEQMYVALEQHAEDQDDQAHKNRLQAEPRPGRLRAEVLENRIGMAGPPDDFGVRRRESRLDPTPGASTTSSWSSTMMDMDRRSGCTGKRLTKTGRNASPSSSASSRRSHRPKSPSRKPRSAHAPLPATQASLPPSRSSPRRGASSGRPRAATASQPPRRTGSRSPLPPPTEAQDEAFPFPGTLKR